jgi:putative ABC transport system ATP-binding protein
LDGFSVQQRATALADKQGQVLLDTMSNNESSVECIKLRSVTKDYTVASGSFRALSRIDLSLPRATSVAFVGRSGSGKSTLMNLIAGIDRPSTGEVWVGDTAVHALNEDQLARWRGQNVGIVFQFFQLLPTLTIAENVMMPMDFCGSFSPRKARERALALLEQVGIANQADKLPSALSGGQQQRAAIARALANDPPVVLADEPTGNLDSNTSRAVLELLTGLKRAGKTVLIVTHERDIASWVDDVITLVDGAISHA